MTFQTVCLGQSRGFLPSQDRPSKSIRYGNTRIPLVWMGALPFGSSRTAAGACRLPHRAGVTVAAGSGEVDHRRWWHVSRDVCGGIYDVVRNNLASLAAVFLVTESVNFVVNRVFHRLTNEAAMSVLGYSSNSIGNLWWLSQNPNLGTAYQVLTALVFVMAFPCSVLIKTIQSVYFFYLSSDNSDDLENENIVSGIHAGVERAKGMWPRVKEVVPRVLAVEFLVSLVVVPLQFVSLLVFSLPFTLPIIMSVHVALPVAIAEHVRGWDALKRSRELMKPMVWGAALPFVCIVICQRLIQVSKEKLIGMLPMRFYYELLEIPLGILALGFAASVLASLARQSLPYVCYTLCVNDKE